MRNELRGAAIVITGALSGIGRLTARRFAERGANLVLVARRAGMLEEAADECRARGVDAVAVPGDVAEPADMQRAADEAMRRFGAIDVWTNNAGVMMFGRFEDTPMDDFRRVLETNLFGVVNGTRAALPYMILRNKGVIINNASIVGHLGQPYSAAYVTSKFAVRGFTIALRQELSDRPGIDVCAVLAVLDRHPALATCSELYGTRSPRLPSGDRSRDRGGRDREPRRAAAPRACGRGGR